MSSQYLTALVLRDLNIGIVGGGIAGLYTALLLQRQGHQVRIFEGSGRIGGRVHTHYFTTEKNQYYEAGAMRIPNSDFHQIIFQLIDYINTDAKVPESKKIKLIDYIMSDPGNDVFLNNIRPDIQAFSVTPASIGWDVPSEYRDKTASDLLTQAIGGCISSLKDNFDQGFKDIVEMYDNFTFRFYCTAVMNWPSEVVDFVETVTSQTNQFSLSVPELVMQHMDFGETSWKTIDEGMSRLPQAMAHLIGLANITFGARVVGLENIDDHHVRVTTSGYNGLLTATFDRVVLAIPPAALRMIADRPRWSAEKEMAIRSMHFEALYKMGMRFKTRFWEHVTPGPSNGGQSTTDLPIRWVVFPSNGCKEDGPGVLLVYAWMTDANNWLSLSALERRSLAINCIEKLYDGRKDDRNNIINVGDLLIETSDAIWSTSTATGDAMFLPGQFSKHFDNARRHEGNIYFAGEHLSYHHTWLSGAARSALDVTRDMLQDKALSPLNKATTGKGRPYVFIPKDRAPAKENGAAKVPFKYGQDHSRLVRRWPPIHSPEVPREVLNHEYNFPTNLGISQHALGPSIANLKAPNTISITELNGTPELTNV
ncbi:hypothetical protein M426DRAFT_15985 [Hypoxylon sp. CI-4A]|nr:hypothetical protein M426DRAFT_15985 [Hypoxylon sp. CI-4A]